MWVKKKNRDETEKEPNHKANGAPFHHSQIVAATPSYNLTPLWHARIQQVNPQCEEKWMRCFFDKSQRNHMGEGEGGGGRGFPLVHKSSRLCQSPMMRTSLPFPRGFPLVHKSSRLCQSPMMRTSLPFPRGFPLVHKSSRLCQSPMMRTSLPFPRGFPLVHKSSRLCQSPVMRTS